MRAAIYARYSSDLQLDSSIEDQVRLCRQRAKDIGADVVEIYADAALSGSRLLSRPSIIQMLGDAKAGRFDVVITEAIDRLSRDQEDIAGIFKRLGHVDVRILSLAEGEISELHIGLKGTMNALFLKDLANRVRRGQGGRVEAGRAGGGLVYGYRVVKRYDDRGEPIRGLREIDPDQAAVVLRIYRAYAAGASTRAIAGQLNADGIPSPRGGQWNASTMTGQRKRQNGILQNPIYIGRIVYNRQGYRKDPDSGQRMAVTNPETAHVTKDVPELRIVPDDLWEATRQQIRRNLTGSGNAEQKRRPKYLLSRLVVCGCCGSNYIVTNRQFMACGRERESRDCGNKRRIAIHRLEAKVLDALRHHMAAPEAIAHFVAEFRAKATEIKAERKRKSGEAGKQVKDLTAKISRVVDAITAGTDTPAMRRQLVDLEAKLQAWQDRAAAVASGGDIVDLHPNLAAMYQKRLDDLRTRLGNPSCRDEAQALIRGLIDRIVLRPIEGQREMDVEIVGQMANLAAIAFGANEGERDGNVSRSKRSIALASPTGFEPVLPT